MTCGRWEVKSQMPTLLKLLEIWRTWNSLELMFWYSYISAKWRTLSLLTWFYHVSWKCCRFTYPQSVHRGGSGELLDAAFVCGRRMSIRHRSKRHRRRRTYPIVVWLCWFGSICNRAFWGMCLFSEQSDALHSHRCCLYLLRLCRFEFRDRIPRSNSA